MLTDDNISPQNRDRLPLHEAFSRVMRSPLGAVLAQVRVLGQVQ